MEMEKSRGCDERNATYTFFGNKFLYVIFIILHVVWIGLGIAYLIIGALYVDDCDREELLPIWLIVHSLIPILFIVGFLPQYKAGCSDAMKTYGFVCVVAGAVASIGWAVFGAVIVYPNWNKGDCDTVVAKFAFAALTIYWCTMWMWIQFLSRMLYMKCCYKG